MLFNSWAFLALFLPFSLGIFLLNQRSRKPLPNSLVLVFCSLIFYGVWYPPYLLLLLGSIGVNHTVACKSHACIKQSGETAGNKKYLILGVGFNILILSFFKYYNFFIESLNFVSGSSYPLIEIILPLAISFYSIQQIIYQVDIYRGRYQPASLQSYTFFVSFFPQLIAGPIVRYQQIEPYIERLNYYRLNPRNCAVGFSLFQFGLAKKVLIADSLSRFVDPVYGAAASGENVEAVGSVFSSYFYCLQLYFDFASYSTMAIGLAWIFGIKLPLNFIAPIRAASPRELWQRWHLTLTNFFRDYFYLPLNKKRLVNGVCHRPGVIWRACSLMALFLLSGLWHGANWTFVIWGFLHGIMFIVHYLWSHLTRPFYKMKNSIPYKIVASVVFFLFMMLAIVFFRAPSFEVAMQVLNPVFHGSFSELLSASGRYIDSVQIDFLKPEGVEPLWVLLAIVFASYFLCYVLPTTEEMFNNVIYFPELDSHKRSLLSFSWKSNVLFMIMGTVLFLLCLVFLSENTPFIYFQF